MRNHTPWLSVVPNIGWVTFREIIRDKILYNILVISVLLMGLGFLASKMTFVTPDRIILDFGVSAVGISSVAIAILLGSGMVNRELERRTIFLALSRPISRFQFIFGKYLGLIFVLVLNWILICSTFLAILLITGDGPANFHATLFSGLVLLLAQSVMMGGIAILISTFSTTSLTAVLSIGIFLIGTNVSQISVIATKTKGIGRHFLEALSFVLPNLEYFNLDTKITYGIPISSAFVTTSLIYAFVISLITMVIAGILIHQRDV